MKPQDLAVYVFLAAAWGLSFLVVLHSVQAFGWIGAVTFRCFIAAATLLVIAAATRRRLDFSVGWLPLAIVGATTVAGQLIGLSFATPLIGTAMAAIFVAAIPLFSMMMGHLSGIERMTAQGVAGLLLGFAGIILLVGFPAVPATASFVLGCSASIASAVCAAFGSNYASVRLRGVGSWEVTIGAFLFGGLLSAPLLMVVPVPTSPGLIDYGYLIVSACVMSALTYVLYFRLVSVIGPTRAISVEFAVTVIAVLVGALHLGERISAVQITGAAAIICGCLLVLGLYPKRRPRVAPIP